MGILKDKLEKKIVNLEDFFRSVAAVLEKKIKFERLYFLIPDQNSNFVTKYSTDGGKIILKKNEAEILREKPEKLIYYPKINFQANSLLEKILRLKLSWKIRKHRIFAIMPIYSGGRAICIILFSGLFPVRHFAKNIRCLENIRREMGYSLEGIILYNQALRRIIREYGI